MSLPNCPLCDSEFTYEDRELLVCPECGHERNPENTQTQTTEEGIKDSNGNLLQDGDTIIVIKDLKFNGGVVKMGTKVKNIKLNLNSDHDIDCKIDGIGAMGLKSEFVKKA